MANGRDAKGRFAKGNNIAKGHNGGKAGRPKKEYLDVMRECVNLDDWATITNSAMARAKAGCHQSREFLAKYLLGVPKQKVDVKTEGEAKLIIEYVNNWRDHQAA